MKVRVIASLVMAACLAAGSANASSIGAFFTADASDCDFQTPNFFTLHVIAILGGDAAAAGISGAELRVTGLEDQAPAPTWFVSVTPNPAANVVIGNPTTAGGGVNLGFPSCQAPMGGRVSLFTVSVFANGPPVLGERTFAVLRHTVPTNANFQCPLVTLCDPPTFTKVCVPGGEAFLNRGEGTCTVGVQQTSWSQVKSLFN
jgi:hypothetical protein